MTDPALSLQLEHRFAASGFELRAQLEIGDRWNFLFGPSGAGKSSLLRAVAGLLRPQHGAIRTANTLWFDSASRVFLPPEKRNIGYLAQQPSLFPHLSVEENVAFGQRYAARPLDIAPLLTMFRCEHMAGRKPSELSGGEQQRVALARALARGPAILLLDEPFRGLDTELREAILHDLQAYLEERPIPVLAVSHDPLEILGLDGQAFRINDGSVVASGPAREVLSAELHYIIEKLNRLPS